VDRERGVSGSRSHRGIFVGGVACEVEGEGCGDVGVVSKFCIFMGGLVEECGDRVGGGHCVVSCYVGERQWVLGLNEYCGEACGSP
jgi:hypothetical protein